MEQTNDNHETINGTETRKLPGRCLLLMEVVYDWKMV